MLFNDTVLLIPAPIADSRFTKVGLSDYTASLLSDTFHSVAASIAEQEQGCTEMAELLELSEQEYAERRVTLEQVQFYMVGHPDTNLTANEIRLELAREQRDAISVLLASRFPRTQVKSGKIKSKLLVSFSETENVDLQGTLLPRTLVRPPSPRSPEVVTSAGMTAELELDFTVIETKC